MIPLLAAKALAGNIGQIIILVAAAALALMALSQAGMLIELVVSLVEWVVTDLGGAAGEFVMDLLAAIVKALGADAIGV
ncbi:hypothetical protein [Halorussus aquaticus]|uniref:Uncharacterized protein n=1 Tax=Halorussus aquaticus TaxID=2953748 RepID=A0ABD5Q2X0_9EURY|nr:hypothetical protein [Halorussus aquaticus]